MKLALLTVFVPTFFFVSITPGMCMTLALSLGMSVGYRRTLWMMCGEMLGIGLVALTAVLGIASVMISYPWLFNLLKLVGSAYLFYLGISLWQSKGKLAFTHSDKAELASNNWGLFMQGFITAIANPKGWAFMISLLPPFIDESQPLLIQLVVLVSIILFFEFVCMSIYATGGKSLKHLLGRSENVRTMNKVSGLLIIGVSIWLWLS